MTRKPTASALGWVVLAFQAVDRRATSETAREDGMSRKDRRYSGAVITPPVALHASAGKPWPGLRSVNGERRRFVEFPITCYHLLSFLRKLANCRERREARVRRQFAARAARPWCRLAFNTGLQGGMSNPFSSLPSAAKLVFSPIRKHRRILFTGRDAC
jgi:hypothetical protein